MARHVRGTAYYPQKGDSARECGGRRTLRDVVIGGNSGPIAGAAFNKVDPLNPATVYQDFKGPFNLNQTYLYGEQLIVKFAERFTCGPGQNNLKTMLLTDGDTPMWFKNTSPHDDGGLPSFYVMADLIYEDFDPETLCWNNQPDSNNYIVTGDHGRDWNPFGPYASGTHYLLYACIGTELTGGYFLPINETLYAQSAVEPDPDLRVSLLCMGDRAASRTKPRGFAAFAATQPNSFSNSDRAPSTLSTPFTGTVSNLTPTTFDLDTGTNHFGFWLNDGALDGWTFYILDTTDEYSVRVGTIASYVAANQRITFSMTDPSKLIDNVTALILYPPVYGVRFWLYQYQSHGGPWPIPPGINPPYLFDGQWPGVETLEVHR